MFKDCLKHAQQALVRAGACYLKSDTVLPNALDAAEFPTPYYPAEPHLQHVEIIVPMSGRAAVMINSSWHSTELSPPLVILRGTPHTEHWLRRDMAYVLFWMIVAPGGLNLHQTTYSPENGYGFSGTRVHTTSPFAAELWQCSQEDDVDIAEFHTLLLESINYPLKHGGFDSLSYHNDILLQVRNFIDRYYFRTITLGELGALSHYTPPHLNRLFRGCFGCSIYAYLQKVRLQNASRMLKDGNSRVKEIAAATGFGDQRYFCRVFQKHFAISPSEYRRRCRAENAGDAASGIGKQNPGEPPDDESSRP